MRFHKQSGIALGPILFIIAILAILAAAIATGSVGFFSKGQTESAKVMASTIIAYGEELQTAVQYVQTTNSCDVSQISFENPTLPYYVNSHTPSNHLCHIFDPRGGAVIVQRMPNQALDPCCTIAGTDAEYGYIRFVGYYDFGVGSHTQGDLVVVVPNISLAVCKQIDSMLNASYTQMSSIYGAAYGDQTQFWNGTFSLGNAAWTAVPSSNVNQACYYQVSNGLRLYYRVLVAQ